MGEARDAREQKRRSQPSSRTERLRFYASVRQIGGRPAGYVFFTPRTSFTVLQSRGSGQAGDRASRFNVAIWRICRRTFFTPR